MATDSSTTNFEEWKLDEYSKLGFTSYQARRLLDVPGLDLGTVRKLLGKGCSIELAYRIFRP